MNNPTFRNVSIAPGPQGTQETLRLMTGLVQESVNDSSFCLFVHDLWCLRGLQTPHDIDRFIRSVYRYEDETIETLYSPRFNVEFFNQWGYITGDCDDITMFYCAVFKKIGWPARMHAMQTKPNDENFRHVVPEVFYFSDNRHNEQRWIRFDPTVSPTTQHVYYGSMIQNV